MKNQRKHAHTEGRQRPSGMIHCNVKRTNNRLPPKTTHWTPQDENFKDWTNVQQPTNLNIIPFPILTIWWQMVACWKTLRRQARRDSPFVAFERERDSHSIEQRGLTLFNDFELLKKPTNTICQVMGFELQNLSHYISCSNISSTAFMWLTMVSSTILNSFCVLTPNVI